MGEAREDAFKVGRGFSIRPRLRVPAEQVLPVVRSASGDLRTCLVAFSHCDAAAGRPGGCEHFPCLGHFCMYDPRPGD